MSAYIVKEVGEEVGGLKVTVVHVVRYDGQVFDVIIPSVQAVKLKKGDVVKGVWDFNTGLGELSRGGLTDSNYLSGLIVREWYGEHIGDPYEAD